MRQTSTSPRRRAIWSAWSANRLGGAVWTAIRGRLRAEPPTDPPHSVGSYYLLKEDEEWSHQILDVTILAMPHWICDIISDEICVCLEVCLVCVDI